MRVMRNVTLDHTGNYDPSVTRCHTEAHRHIFNTMFRTVQMARGGGGGGRNSHMEQTRMLVGNFELNP